MDGAEVLVLVVLDEKNEREADCCCCLCEGECECELCCNACVTNSTNSGFSFDTCAAFKDGMELMSVDRSFAELLGGSFASATSVELV